MILDIILILLNMLGFDDNKPKYDLHKKQEGFKLNDANIILILIIIGCIFFVALFFLIGHCTDSGVYYNSNLY